MKLSITCLAICSLLGTVNAGAANLTGTAERVTFEDLLGCGCTDIPNGYDGLYWGNLGPVPKHSHEYHRDLGVHAVLHGKVAAMSQSQGTVITIEPVSGTFSLVNGHFAAAINQGNIVDFYAYRNGVQVGTYETFLNPADTVIVFDKTFAHIDQIQIFGHTLLAMDNLKVRFYSH